MFPQILAYFEAEKSELFDFYLIQTRLSEDQSKQWEWKEFLEGVAGAVQRLKDLVDEQNCLFRDLKEAAERMEQGQGRKKEMQITSKNSICMCLCNELVVCNSQTYTSM